MKIVYPELPYLLYGIRSHNWFPILKAGFLLLMNFIISSLKIDTPIKKHRQIIPFQFWNKMLIIKTDNAIIKGEKTTNPINKASGLESPDSPLLSPLVETPIFTSIWDIDEREGVLGVDDVDDVEFIDNTGVIDDDIL